MSQIGLTKVPLGMLGARGNTNAKVIFDGQQVELETDAQSADSTAVVSGNFDDVSGVLTLNLGNGTAIQVTGFMTPGNIGTGPAGQQGNSGINGADGLLGVDGLQGPTGCQGPPGTPGATGPQGLAGVQGPEGRAGERGEKGDQGNTGVVAIWIQTDDPGAAAGAGAFWVRP